MSDTAFPNARAYRYDASAERLRGLLLVLIVSIPPDLVISHLFLSRYPIAMWMLDALGVAAPLSLYRTIRVLPATPHLVGTERARFRRGHKHVEIDISRIAGAAIVPAERVRSLRRRAIDLTVGSANVVEVRTRDLPPTKAVLINVDDVQRFLADPAIAMSNE